MAGQDNEDYVVETINAPLTMRPTMTTASAETLALKALGYLADLPQALERFLGESGAEVPILRERASDPVFLAAVVDFLLADDGLAAGFCDAESLEPRSLHLARHLLPGG